jgi:hypothetical protein
MLPGIVGLLTTDNQQAFGFFGLGLVTVAVVGLLLSIPGVLLRGGSAAGPAESARPGARP